MSTVTLAHAQAHLADLVSTLPAEGEFLIFNGTLPVARLCPVGPTICRSSLRDHRGSSVGVLLRPYPEGNDDVLGELLGAS